MQKNAKRGWNRAGPHAGAQANDKQNARASYFVSKVYKALCFHRDKQNARNTTNKQPAFMCAIYDSGI